MANWSTGISLKGGPGKDGVGVIFAQGAPASGLVGAVDQQQYFDVTNLLVYTWSAANSSWGTGTTYRGPMGINGVDGSFFYGVGAPTASTYSGSGQAVYFQSTGEIWVYKNGSWADTGENFTGPAGKDGVIGKDGLRGTMTYTGHGAPSSDLTSYSPPAVTGDLYYDLDGGPSLYVLGN